MITVPLRIPMGGPWVRGTSGGNCHVRRATPALECTAFPGNCGERPMGHWWSQFPCEFQWRVRQSVARQGGLPCEESHSVSGGHSLPWGLWRETNGPLMITALVWIPMEGPWVRGTSGGGCHVKRATPSLEGTAFPGDCGEWPMGHWWPRTTCEFQWRVGGSVARQGGAAMWGEPLGRLECTVFHGDSGEWPMGHWWSQFPCKFQWRVRESVARQGGAAMWGEPLCLLSAQHSLGTLENDQWAIDDHSSLANSNGGSASPWHVRGGLPCEESHSVSRGHSLPWGLWRETNGPLMITALVGIPMEGPIKTNCCSNFTFKVCNWKWLFPFYSCAGNLCTSYFWKLFFI